MGPQGGKGGSSGAGFRGDDSEPCSVPGLDAHHFTSDSVSMHRPVVAGNLTLGAEVLGTHLSQADASFCITDSEGTTYGDARETRNEAKASSPSVNKVAPEASRWPWDTSQALGVRQQLLSDRHTDNTSDTLTSS